MSSGPLKAALVNYFSQLAKELGPDGIRANAVSPGPIYIDGGSWHRIRQTKPDYCEANKARHPAGRLVPPKRWRMRSRSSPAPRRPGSINGQNLVVDGSFTLRVGY